MTWILLFVMVLIFFGALWKLLDHLYDKAADARADKRAKEHFEKTERYRRGV